MTEYVQCSQGHFQSLKKASSLCLQPKVTLGRRQAYYRRGSRSTDLARRSLREQFKVEVLWEEEAGGAYSFCTH